MLLSAYFLGMFSKIESLSAQGKATHAELSYSSPQVYPLFSLL